MWRAPTWTSIPRNGNRTSSVSGPRSAPCWKRSSGRAWWTSPASFIPTMRTTSPGGRPGGISVSGTSDGGSTTYWPAPRSRNALRHALLIGRLERATMRRWWRRLNERRRGRRRSTELFQDDQHDAPIRRAAGSRRVRLRRKRVAVRDRRHAVELELMLPREIASHGIGAPLSQLVVV